MTTTPRPTHQPPMLSADIGGIRWRFSPLFPALLVVLLSWEKAAPVGRCVAAAFWHESGHMMAMLLCRCRPRDITISMFGIRMEQNRERPLGYRQNIFVSLAGPFMNALAAVFALLCHFQELAFIHFTLMGFNLLPLSMLDGGQALYSIIALRTNPTSAARILRRITYVLFGVLYTAGFLFLLLTGYNISLLITAFYLTLWMFFSTND